MRPIEIGDSVRMLTKGWEEMEGIVNTVPTTAFEWYKLTITKSNRENWAIGKNSLNVALYEIELITNTPLATSTVAMKVLLLSGV
jgi:hypothetical protein